MMQFTTAQVERFSQWGEYLWNDGVGKEASDEDMALLLQLYKLLGKTPPDGLLMALHLPIPKI